MSDVCEECGKPPKGVTMWEGMDGYSCPYCSHYNEFE
jgi:DNA-directed RNA polymerase subunit RPC12/RpoP